MHADMDPTRTAAIADAVKLVAEEQLKTQREQIRLGGLRGEAAYRAGETCGMLFAARDRVLLCEELVETLRECIGVMSSLRDFVAEGGSIQMIGAHHAINEADKLFDRAGNLIRKLT
jgi:hypothetical protein